MATATRRTRTYRSAHFETDSARAIRFQRKRGRTAQSAERRSRRAAAEPSRGIARVLERNIRAGAEHVAIFEIGRDVYSAIGKRRTASRNFALGKCRRRGELAIRRRNAASICSISKARWNAIVPNLSFRPGKFPDLALPVDIFSGDQNDRFRRPTFRPLKSNAPGPVFVAELHADLLLMPERAERQKFRELEKFPPSPATSR